MSPNAQSVARNAMVMCMCMCPRVRVEVHGT
jgi:hypothetical protein